MPDDRARAWLSIFGRQLFENARLYELDEDSLTPETVAEVADGARRLLHLDGYPAMQRGYISRLQERDPMVALMVCRRVLDLVASRTP